MFEDLKSALGWLATGLSGILMWVANREIHRVDRLEEKVDKCLTKEEFNETMSKWREEDRATLSRIHERVDKIWERG